MSMISLDQNSQELVGLLSSVDEIIFVWSSEPKNIKPCIIQLSKEKIKMMAIEDGFPADEGELYFYIESKKALFKSEVSKDRDGLEASLPQNILILDDGQSSKIHDALYKIQVGEKESEVPSFSSEQDEKFMVYEGQREKITKSHMELKKLGLSQKDQDLFQKELDSISLDEEDKLYADKREAPRAKPKIDKTVSIYKADNEQKDSFDLYDLSMGGMSFKSDNISNIDIGQQIQIAGFDDQFFDEPLVGIIRNIREIENEESFKVGVQFVS